jgi:hypothetical protein
VWILGRGWWGKHSHSSSVVRYLFHFHFEAVVWRKPLLFQDFSNIQRKVQKQYNPLKWKTSLYCGVAPEGPLLTNGYASSSGFIDNNRKFTQQPTPEYQKHIRGSRITGHAASWCQNKPANIAHRWRNTSQYIYITLLNSQMPRQTFLTQMVRWALFLWIKQKKRD